LFRYDLNRNAAFNRAKTLLLLRILGAIREHLPTVERVSSYIGAALDTAGIQRKGRSYFLYAQAVREFLARQQDCVWRIKHTYVYLRRISSARYTTSFFRPNFP